MTKKKNCSNWRINLRAESGDKVGKPTLKLGTDLVGKIWEIWKTDMAFD